MLPTWKINIAITMILIVVLTPLIIPSNNVRGESSTLDSDSLILLYVVTMDDKVKSQIPDADVYLDGEKVGTTNETGSLTILTLKGTHTIVIRADGYEEKSIKLYIVYDSPLTVYLKPKEVNIPIGYYAIYIVLAIVISVAVALYYKSKKGENSRLIKIKGV